jgi:hypothetical protein
MAAVKSMAVIKEKWARVTPGRTEDYRIGIQNPRRDWADAATAQEDTWKQAITEAATRGQYGKGVAKAGTAKWKDRSIKKGPTRFAEGVMVGAEDYAKGFAPMHDAIEAVTPPPKFPRGDPRNIDRVRVYNQALHAKRVQG